MEKAIPLFRSLNRSEWNGWERNIFFFFFFLCFGEPNKIEFEKNFDTHNALLYLSISCNNVISLSCYLAQSILPPSKLTINDIKRLFVPFFMFFFIFQQPQLVMYLFDFSYKITKV